MDVMLSDNAKRFLCRLGFVALCIIPTVWCLKYILFPPTDAQWAAQLQQQFGVANQPGEVRVLSPQRTDLSDWVLGNGDFESHVIIDQASLQNRHDGRLLHITQAAGSPAAIWHMLNRMTWQLSRTSKSDRPQRVLFESVSFLQADGKVMPGGTWKQLNLLVGDQGRRWTISFLPAELAPTNAEEDTKTVTIKRTADAHGYHWYVDARGWQLPVALLQAGIPILHGVNPDAVMINGLASLRENQGRWSGEVRGQIGGIDLEYVVQRNFGTAISGVATATITSAIIADNRLQEIEGHLISSSGVIGADLLAGFRECLAMQIVQPYGGQDQTYRDLRFGFLMRNHALAIFADEAGAIAHSDDGHAMLIPPHGQPHPVNNLFALLAWPHQHFFATPLTPNVASLAQRIALPGG
ncbi:MAG: hypothetical protein ACR2NP_15920, partial [Pirellulaceae bacterium]